MNLETGGFVISQDFNFFGKGNMQYASLAVISKPGSNWKTSFEMLQDFGEKLSPLFVRDILQRRIGWRVQNTSLFISHLQDNV